MAPFECVFNSYGFSDIGPIRENNEDVWISLKKYGFFALADGMGGHNAGEIAAQEAIRFVCAAITELFSTAQNKLNTSDLLRFSKLTIEQANNWVHCLGNKHKDHLGMGTTLCTLLFHKKSLIYGHVGDSRIYRFRQCCLKALTFDHSLKNKMLLQGKPQRKNGQNFLYTNILTRAIGIQNKVAADLSTISVNLDDIYLMCTDGLTDFVDNETIARVLKREKSPKSATLALIEEVKKRKGNDNITIVIVKIDPSPPLFSSYKTGGI